MIIFLLMTLLLIYNSRERRTSADRQIDRNLESYRNLSQILSPDVTAGGKATLFPDTWMPAPWFQPVSSALLKITAVTSLFWPIAAPTQSGVRGNPQRRQEEAKNERKEAGKRGEKMGKMVFI